MMTRRVVPHHIKRLEYSGNAVFIGLTVAQAVLGLKGRSSLTFSVLYLLLIGAAVFYAVRARPRLSNAWPVASGSRARTREWQASAVAPYLLATLVVTLGSAAGSAVLALGHLAAGAGLLMVAACMTAVVWRMRWPFE
jgi:hypothetical protein